jgi:hypothetical protein
VHIRFAGDSFSERVKQEIVELTDHSLIQVDTLRYDTEQGLVELLVDRFPVVRQKTRRFWQTKFARDYETKIRSIVLIRNVTSCEIEDHCEAYEQGEVTMMLGLGIKSGTVFFISHEEDRGIHSCSMSATVSKLGIEIRDL